MNITIALSKGRILKDTLELFRKINLEFDVCKNNSRKLYFELKEKGIKLILSKPWDVPTYVEYGVADLGIAGKDVLMEDKREVFELMDLKIAQCKIALAVLEDWDYSRPIEKVTTKYPNISYNYFLKKSQSVEIIKLNGSVELGPVLGLSDAIVDIVSTGNTLKENHLKIYEDICPISSRLIANQVSFRLKHHSIQNILDKLKKTIEVK